MSNFNKITFSISAKPLLTFLAALIMGFVSFVIMSDRYSFYETYYKQLYLCNVIPSLLWWQTFENNIVIDLSIEFLGVWVLLSVILRWVFIMTYKFILNVEGIHSFDNEPTKN